MPTVSQVCSHVRSKNAGPFWITLDFSFADRAMFDQHARSSAFTAATVAATYDVDAKLVKVFHIPDLCVVKISYPRRRPQGGYLERDMHGGQQFVQLLDVEVT